MEVRERAEAMREAAASGSRIGLTELSRSNAWRKALEERGVLEIVDRVDPAAYLMSVDAMNELLDTINELEARLEHESLQAMFSSRQDREERWQSGQSLVADAKAYLHEHGDSLTQLLAGE